MTKSYCWAKLLVSLFGLSWKNLNFCFILFKYLSTFTKLYPRNGWISCLVTDVNGCVCLIMDAISCTCPWISILNLRFWQHILRLHRLLLFLIKIGQMSKSDLPNYRQDNNLLCSLRWNGKGKNDMKFVLYNWGWWEEMSIIFIRSIIQFQIIWSEDLA